MSSQTRYGANKEQKVARSLRARGATVKESPDSRGAADLKAKFPSGTKWNVQVKSTRAGQAASPGPKDLGRLKQSATKEGATPVVAKVSPKSIDFESARSGKTLTPPKK